MPAKPLSRAHRRLVSELRQLREARGLSGQDLGDLLDWSQSKVSKIENGRTRPSVADVAAWGEVVGASAETTNELVELTESVSTETHPWAPRHGSLASRTEVIAQVESEMTGLQNFQAGVIPGLLQTADYARHVINLLDVAGERDVAAAVSVRMQRQAVLYDQAKRFDFLLTEAALRWRPGPSSLLLAQLDRLFAVATLPNVTIGVLPLDHEAVALHTNGFTIFEVPDAPFVHIETLTLEQFLHDESDLNLYRETFARLRSAALTDAEATGFIRQIMADLLVE